MVTRERPFIGREAVIREVVDAVSEAQPLIAVVTGVGGVGKTALLDELARRVASAETSVLRVRVTEFAPAASAQDAEAPLTVHRQLLEKLAAQLAPGDAEGFREYARRRQSDATSPAAVDVAHDDIRDALVALVPEQASTITVLADDISTLGGAALLGRLLDLLRSLSQRAPVVAVLTQSQPPPKPVEYPSPVIKVTLGALERTEAERYLAGTGADRRWINAIERWCGRYPAAVVLGAQLAAEFPDRPEVLGDASVVDLRGQDLLDTLMASLHEEAERQAMEVAAVLRHFDAELLRFVLAVSDVSAAPDLDEWLSELPFVERLGEGRYRLRPFLRILLTLRLRRERPRGADYIGSRLDEVHHRVTQHYRQAVLKDAHRRGYRSWSTLEDRVAQERQLEFLHHALLNPENRHRRLWIAQAYFDAFWWWGAYVESDFCRRLLDGSEREARPDDRPFLHALRRFEAAYPSEVSGASRDWAGARAAIDEIAEEIGIDRSVTELTGEEMHLRAILEVFRGEAHAALDQGQAEAQERYALAYKLFDRNPEDRWCLPWVRVYQSALAAAGGRRQEAVARAHDGLKLARDADQRNRDYEVEAMLHRAVADALWEDGARWSAFRALAKAVFFAYSFTSLPDVPDEYTRTLYREVSAGALDRILELRATPAELRRACAGFVRFWSPYWEVAGGPPDLRSIDSLLRSNPRDLAHCIFPAPPADDDLEHEGPYTARVRAVHAALEPSLDAAADVFGKESMATRLRTAVSRRRQESLVEVSGPELPSEPAEPPDLFEPGDDPVWPDHWRTVPDEWRPLREQDPERPELEALVASVLHELPPSWRELVQRRDVERWTCEDTARRLGISPSHQTLILHHSRARIRAALAARLSEAAP